MTTIDMHPVLLNNARIYLCLFFVCHVCLKKSFTGKLKLTYSELLLAMRNMMAIKKFSWLPNERGPLLLLNDTLYSRSALTRSE